jgi:integration host factor subunit beta
MIKSELIAKVAEKSKVRHREASLLVESIFGAMREAILNGERIELRGFGSFANRQYTSYQGRNPKTGASIQVSPRKIPFFKVGKELREKINGGPGKNGSGSSSPR